jgi:hypothetical protein
MLASAVGQATSLFAGWALSRVTLVLHSQWVVTIRWNSVAILELNYGSKNIL